MNTLEVIAKTIAAGNVHPTLVLNTFIDVENIGGQSALYELEDQLSRLYRNMRQHGDAGLHMARAWLDSLRAYLEDHAPLQPVAMPQRTRRFQPFANPFGSALVL